MKNKTDQPSGEEVTMVGPVEQFLDAPASSPKVFGVLIEADLDKLDVTVRGRAS